MSDIKLSIIFSVKNSELGQGDFLDTFIDQTLSANEYEIIWINSERNISNAILKRKEFFKNLQATSNTSRNQVAETARGHYLLFLTEPYWVERNFLNGLLLSTLENKNTIQCIKRMDETPTNNKVGQFLHSWIKSTWNKYSEFWEGGFLILKSQFQNINGFDEHPVFEKDRCSFQKDILNRLRNNGEAIRVEPKYFLYLPYSKESVAHLWQSEIGKEVIQYRVQNGRTLPVKGLYENKNDILPDKLNIKIEDSLKEKKSISVAVKTINRISKKLFNMGHPEQDKLELLNQKIDKSREQVYATNSNVKVVSEKVDRLKELSLDRFHNIENKLKQLDDKIQYQIEAIEYDKKFSKDEKLLPTTLSS